MCCIVRPTGTFPARNVASIARAKSARSCSSLQRPLLAEQRNMWDIQLLCRLQLNKILKKKSVQFLSLFFPPHQVVDSFCFIHSEKYVGHPPLVAVCRRGIGSGTGKAACFRESTSMPVFLDTTPSKEEAVAELGVQLCDDWHRILLLRLGFSLVFEGKGRWQKLNRSCFFQSRNLPPSSSFPLHPSFPQMQPNRK